MSDNNHRQDMTRSCLTSGLRRHCQQALALLALSLPASERKGALNHLSKSYFIAASKVDANIDDSE